MGRGLTIEREAATGWLQGKLFFVRIYKYEMTRYRGS